LALAYFVWTRHWFALSLVAGYWLALIVLSRTLPGEPISVALGGLLSASPCAFPFLLVFFTFSQDSRLEARESGFPSRLCHLPLPTYALVGWPMLWGSIGLALAWLTLDWGALRPALRHLEIEPPLWVPALTLAATLAWLQAIIWTPFPLPWLRPFVLIPLISPLAALILLSAAYDFSQGIVCGVLIAVILAAYAVAVAGVARARRGDVPYWTWPGWSAWLRWISSTRGRPEFGSPRQAQVWYEWRRVGLGFSVMMFATTFIWLPFIPTIAAFIDDAHGAGLVLVPPFLLREVGSLWLVAAYPLIFAPLLSSVCGWEMARLPGPKRGLALSSFMATRPISTWTFVRAKFEMAALSTLAGWSVAGLALLLWIALGGHAAEMADSFGALRQRHPGSSLWIGLVLLILGAVVMTWLQMVQGLWMGLAGRAWVKAMPALGLIVLISVLFLGQWLARSPQHWQRFSELLPWLAGVTVALKALLAFRVSQLLVRRHLAARNLVGGALAVWVLSVAGLFCLLYWLLPRDNVPVSALVLAIVLLLPLTRVLLAPLALAWNRHR
jgi:hypothetical protein